MIIREISGKSKQNRQPLVSAKDKLTYLVSIGFQWEYLKRNAITCSYSKLCYACTITFLSVLSHRDASCLWMFHEKLPETLRKQRL